MSEFSTNEQVNKNVVTGGNIWDAAGNRSGGATSLKPFGKQVLRAFIKTCGLIMFIIIAVTIYKHPEFITNLF